VVWHFQLQFLACPKSQPKRQVGAELQKKLGQINDPVPKLTVRYAAMQFRTGISVEKGKS
jgi:hypothetical protein